MKRIITIVFAILSLQMSAQCWQTVSAGDTGSLAIKNDGTLWTWGSSGTDSVGLVNTPTQLGTANNWTKISAGYGSAGYAIKADGTLWGWGWNAYGQIGIGIVSDFVNEPTQVGTDNNWLTVKAGTNHCLALKTDGTLWTWGRNHYGQLGDNTMVDKSAPIQVGTETDWQTISAGGHVNLAIKSNGTLWAWGRNSSGEVGDGTNTHRSVPTQVGTDTNWLKVEGGYFHSTAIKTNGTLWAWGSNAKGQLGDGTTTAKNVPTQVGTLDTWLDVSAGYNFTYGIRSNHTLWSWGINSDGQLGNGTSGTASTVVPTQVGSSSDTFEISAGYYHTLEKNSDGYLRACGKNVLGQLGDGTNNDRATLITIGCSTLSLADYSKSKLKIFPNPVEDNLNINGENPIQTVEIYNMLGRRILSNPVNDTKTKLSLSHLPSGIYLLKIYSNKNVETLKFAKN